MFLAFFRYKLQVTYIAKIIRCLHVRKLAQNDRIPFFFIFWTQKNAELIFSIFFGIAYKFIRFQVGFCLIVLAHQTMHREDANTFRDA